MDNGRTDSAAEEAAREAYGVGFSVCRRTNAKRRDEPAEAYYRVLMRRRVEAVFSEITRLFLNRAGRDGEMQRPASASFGRLAL